MTEAPELAAAFAFLAPTAPHDRHGLHPAPPAIIAWEDHVAAGRIGASPPSAPETVAARQVMERVVLGRG